MLLVLWPLTLVFLRDGPDSRTRSSPNRNPSLTSLHMSSMFVEDDDCAIKCLFQAIYTLNFEIFHIQEKSIIERLFVHMVTIPWTDDELQTALLSASRRFR